MAIAPVALLTIGTTAFGAVTSAVAAREQNKQIEAASKSAAKAAKIQQSQVLERAKLEKQKRQNEADRVRGRIRVAAGEAGVGLGGSFEALQRQADYDSELDQHIIDTNAFNQSQRIRSGAQAQIRSLTSQATNPILSAFTGGLGGFQTGLGIGTSLNSIELGNLGAQSSQQATSNAAISTANTRIAADNTLLQADILQRRIDQRLIQ